MAVKLNAAGRSHANSLISAGKVDSGDWAFSPADSDALLGDPPDWTAYGRWFLGQDTAAERETKAAWKYPFGKNGKVYAGALRAIASRAAQQNETDISEAASAMLEKINAAEEEQRRRQAQRRRPANRQAARERETFRARFAVINTDLAEGTFEGYASVFGSPVDTWPPTIVDPGCFAKTLAENKERVRILYQHDPTCPIGRPVSLEEDDKGLHIVAKISDTELGREALTLIRDGVLAEMSIGFDAIQWEMKADPLAPNDPSRMIRHLREVRLWEVSLVTWGADPMAQVYSVHSLQAAPPAYHWSREAADARVREWASRFQEDRPPRPVQSVICSKDRFETADDAASWVKDHGFRADKLDETEQSYRFRQFPPGDCSENTLRTIELTDGVSAVICQKKESDRARGPAASATESQRLGRYSRACLGGHLVADVIDGRLHLVPLAVVEAGVALLVEQAHAMTADEAKQLLRDAKAALEKVLEAAGGDTGDGEDGIDAPSDAGDQEGGDKKKKQAKADEAQARRRMVSSRLVELEAEAALLGVH